MRSGNLWHYKVDSSEHGTASFAELAALLADGSLTADSLVRRECDEEWCSADSVVGLMRSARAVRAAAELEASGEESPPAQPAAAAAQPKTTGVANGRVSVLNAQASWKRLVVMTLVLGVCTWGLCQWYQSSTRFPRPASAKAEPIRLPLIGALSGLELGLLIVDGLLLGLFGVVMACRWFRQSEPTVQAGANASGSSPD